MLVIWEDKIDKPLALARFKEKKGEYSNNKIKWKMRNNTWHYRNTMIITDNYYKHLYANKMGQPGRNGQILKKIQLSKTEWGRIWNYKQNNHR